MKFEVIFPVIALIAGWLLNELTSYLALRRKGRGALAQALSELLEIRSRMVIIQYGTEYLTHKFQIPNEFASEMRAFYRDFLAVPSNLHQRYDDAVTLIAASNPILGYKLRSENLAGEYIKKLSSFADSKDDDSKIFLEFLSKLEDKIVPGLDNTIRELSKQHGYLTYWKVKRILNAKPQIPTEMESILQEFVTNLDNSSKPQNQTNP